MLTKSDFNEIGRLVKSENNALEKRLSKRFDTLDNILDTTADFLDRDYLRILKRIERIEKHLQLKPLS